MRDRGEWFNTSKTYTPPPPPVVPHWEDVCHNTQRLAVPGGWLYQVTTYRGAVALTFVPTR
jgi:hypothetical protein